MRKQEYGGFLPLELNKKKEYFQYAPEDIRRYNCGRTAISMAVADHRVDKFFVPYFTCDTVLEALEEQNISVERYHLTEDMLPENLEQMRREAGDTGILLVNYYGLMGAQTKKCMSGFQRVILDNTQAFFEPPVLQTGVSNIYSCRKFVGVPDGAYLIEKNTNAPALSSELSWNHYEFICHSYECGTNAAYQENLENDARFHSERAGMSQLTRDVLACADYQGIYEARRTNFLHLQERLGAINRMKFSESDAAPYLYPFWTERDQGAVLRAALLKEKIYPPVLGKDWLVSCTADSLEAQWTRDVLYLPVDQRYGTEDMDVISDVVLNVL